MSALAAPSAAPEINTLADFWRAANIPEGPAWTEQIKLRNRPFRHQVTGLNLLAQDICAGLWDEPGTGKTLQAQAHLLWLVSLGNKVMCVMPPVLVEQFKNSFSANFPGIDPYVSIATYSGNPEERTILLQEWDRSGWPQILVMSNDFFSGKSPTELKALERTRAKWRKKRDELLHAWNTGGWKAAATLCGYQNKPEEEARKLTAARVKKAKNTEQKKETPADTAGPALWLKKGYVHITLDEAVSVKNPGSDLHRAVKKFAGSDNGLVLMTGSPIENTPTDAYGLVSLLTPERYGSYRNFERIHVRQDDSGRFPIVIGYENLDYLWQSLYLKGRRITKREALDLPPQLFSERTVRLAPAHAALYKKLCQERVLELGDKVIDATAASSLYIKSQRMLLCPELFHDAENHGPWKEENTLLTSLDELIKELSGHKLVVFAWFTESIHKLTARYAKLNPAVLFGETTAAERERQKAKFIQDDTCRLIIMNPRSGGVGVDGLQQVCSHAVFAESVSTPGLLDQAISRLHRSGQKSETVNVYFLTALSTVAVTLRNKLIAKEGTANAVVRDAKKLLADLLGEEGLQGSIE